MKTYTGIKLYCKTTPEIWYRNDDAFSTHFTENEEYDFIHIFKDKSKVKYHIDKHGFRNYNSIDSKLWFFGPSYTFGEAIEYEKSFPYLVSKELNLSFFNFGTLGASIDLIIRTIYKMRFQLSEKVIIVCLPSIERYEILLNNQFHSMYPNHNNYFDYLPKYNIESALEYKLIKNIMFLKLLSENNKMHIFSTYNNEILQKNLPINLIPKNLLVDHAYDDKHFGEITNKNIANFIINSIK